MAAYRIVKLDDSWKGRTRQFRYQTDSYLDVQIVEERGVSRIEFRKKMFDAPVEKELEVSWMKDHMAAPMLFAAVDDEEQIAGYLELNPERWNNRMRVANLFVEEPFRRTGAGTVLMRHAVSVAEKAGPGCWCWKPRAATCRRLVFICPRVLPSAGWTCSTIPMRIWKDMK